MATLAQRLAEPDVASLPDWQAADALNVPDVANGTRMRDVPTSDVRGMLLATGEWGAIVLLSRQTPSAQVPAEAVAAAITAIDTLSLTQTLEASKPAFSAAMEAMIAGLLAAGVLSAQTGATLLAMREAPLSWGEANGFPGGVTARDVGLARGARA